MSDNQMIASGTPELSAEESSEAIDLPESEMLAATSHMALDSSIFANETPFQGGLDSSDDQWSVPWADIMMVMFVLFAALLSAKMLNPDIEIQYIPLPEPQIEEVEKDRIVKEQVLSRQPSFEPLMRINVFDRSQDAIRETQLENIDIALLEDQSVKVSVQGPMFFDRGKANLRTAITGFLDKIALIIRQTPFQVQVIGHTDDNPISTTQFPSNWELSVVRASRVARYLIQKGELEPSRFIVMGRGQYAPARPNSDDKTRALNRRVEIIITRKRINSEAQGSDENAHI